jgi:hypothetical protein
MSHRRTRLLAALAATPVLLTAAPLTGLATAATGITAAKQNLPSGLVLGPNAGFLDPAGGISGYTPVFRFSVSSPSAVVQEVRLVVGGDANPFRDFIGGDGFSIFPDVDNDGVFRAVCPEGAPQTCAADFTGGSASDDYAVGVASSSGVPVTIKARTAPGEDPENPVRVATGASSYFVTVRPSDVVAPNRTVSFTLPADGIRTTDGSTGPSAAVNGGEFVLDSVAPPAPRASNFSTRARPAMSESQPLPDGVVVSPAEYNAAPGKKLAFFNTTDESAANLLRLEDGSRAIHTAPAAGGEVSLGDGTGITATVKTAKNNQQTNTVQVRSLDDAGNLSAPVALGNDASAPAPTTIVTGVTNVNIANQAAAPVTVTLTGAPTTATADASNEFLSFDVRLSLLDALNQYTGDSTPWVRGTRAANRNTAVSVNVNATTIADGARIIGQTRLVDALGNMSDVYDSGCSSPTAGSLCPTLSVVTKDTVRPVFLAAAPLSGFGDGAGAGDKIKLFFSERIANQTQIARTSPGDTCQASCVNFRLDVEDGVPSTTVVSGNPVTTKDCVYFGGSASTGVCDPRAGLYNGITNWTNGPGFEWVDGGAGAVITLTAAAGNGFRLPSLDGPGDLFTFDSTALLADAVGNQVTNAVRLVDAGILPIQARTFDRLTTAAGNPHGTLQTRFAATDDPTASTLVGDGFVDTIDVRLDLPTGAAIDDASIEAALANFRVTTSGGELTPTAAYRPFLPASTTRVSDTIRLELPVTTQVGTGDLPVVTLRAENGSTGLRTSGVLGKAIGAFSIGTTDRAVPALVSARTVDSGATPDGKIDQVVLTYSEPVNHAKRDPYAYRVRGYENQSPASARPLVISDTTNSSTPTTGTGTTVTLSLVEQTAGTPPETTGTPIAQRPFDTGARPAADYILRADAGDLIDDRERGVQDSAFLPQSPPLDPTDEVASGNRLREWVLANLQDGAAPVPVARLTRDLDGDGWIDAIDVRYSEPIQPIAAAGSTFIVEGHSFLGANAVTLDTVRVRIDEVTTSGTGDTAARPKIAYTGGLTGSGITDAVGNDASPEPLTETTDETTGVTTVTPTGGQAADGAGPAIMAATASFEGNVEGTTSSAVRVVFSEPVAAGAATDFVVTQGTATPAISGVTLGSEGASADLALETPVNRFQDAFVSFSPETTVKDKADPANTATQRAAVRAVAFPEATLSVTGAPGSAEGYSAGPTGNVLGVTTTASDSAVGWCLKFANTSVDPAPTAPTDPADACFASAAPTSLTVDGIDGAYTFLLVVKDRFNNISQPATDTIVIDRAAPVISAATFKNFTTGSTTSVRDNDTVFAEVTASGPGAAQFATTVDYRPLTSAAGDGAVTGSLRSGSTDTKRIVRFPFRVASGTTVYPVGTLLRPANGNGAVFVLEDGPDGTTVKRQLLSGQALASYRIPASLIITVPNAVTDPIPTGPAKPYRDGLLVRAQGTAPVFVLIDGAKYQFTSRAEFEGLGYEFADVVEVPGAHLSQVPVYEGDFGPGSPIHPAGTFVRNTSDGAVYVVVTGPDGPRKRRIVTFAALNSLVPTSHLIAVPFNHPTLLLPTDGDGRGLRDGMLVQFTNDPRIFVISRGMARHINSRAAFELMGFSFRNVARARPGDIAIAEEGLPVSVRTLTFTITVRDQAGNVASKPVSVSALGRPSTPPFRGSDAPLP